MNARLLIVLLTLAAALWAMAPAAAVGSDGGEPGKGTAQKGEPGGPPDKTSTSPGEREPASGTQPGPGAPGSEPGAQAEDGATAEGELPEASCDARLALRRSLRALKRAVRGHDLLAKRPRPVLVRVAPCMPGTLVLKVVERGGGKVLWRARRKLRTTRRATLRLTMTPAGRRFARRARKGTVRIGLDGRFTPAAA